LQKNKKTKKMILKPQKIRTKKKFKIFPFLNFQFSEILFKFLRNCFSEKFLKIKIAEKNIFR